MKSKRFLSVALLSLMTNSLLSAELGSNALSMKQESFVGFKTTEIFTQRDVLTGVLAFVSCGLALIWLRKTAKYMENQDAELEEQYAKLAKNKTKIEQLESKNRKQADGLVELKKKWEQEKGELEEKLRQKQEKLEEVEGRLTHQAYNGRAADRCLQMITTRMCKLEEECIRLTGEGESLREQLRFGLL